MEHLFILGLIALALVLFAWEVVRPDVVALGVTLVLLLSGTVTLEEGFSGFSNPAVITVIAMFILSYGLVRTGVADIVANTILRVGGENPVLLTLAIMIAVGTMSAVMNNIGAVAVLLPALFVIARRSKYPVTKLLIPLSFGSLMGGLTTLIGTPPNLLVSIALENQGFRGFRMFDFLPTGLAVMAAGALYMTFIGRHLLPERKVANNLTREYQLEDYLTEVVIPEDSFLAGKTIRSSGLFTKFGLTVLRITRRLGQANINIAPEPDEVLQAEDRLIVEGDVMEMLRDREVSPLKIYADRKFNDKMLTDENVQLAEVAIAPNAMILGQSIEQGYIRRHYGVLVLALRRRGETLKERFISVPLEVGDVLLVQGSPETLDELARSHDFLVVNRLEHGTRKSRKAPFALAIMTVSIMLAGTGFLHISTAAMLGVFLMVATGCVRPQDMYHEVEWRVIFLIAFMMPLGIAMDEKHTGTAKWLADAIVAAAGDYGPLALLGCLILFTTLITEVMSNAAAAVLLAPIGIAVAVGAGYEPYPFLMGIAIGASTTFLTPIGHQANVLVYGVGNYRFSDFARTGLLLNLLIFAIAMVLIPMVWPFAPIGN
ncbi:MAG TPA: SLC13 family permease [Pyrinomonadaceae bacterium]|nr:SLC13 family permease [Pyrinomonadaceae bacterium]HMP66042.1 SLC13 family permease [Pyrinomonadaceae bacterium]